MKTYAIALMLLFVLAACGPGKYDAMAQCMTEKGVTFYGAYWCPHCANQKEQLGSAMKYINYVECSLPNKAGQTQVCIDQDIKKYPTWEFENGERVQGFMTPEQLSLKSGCAIG
jgi:hypothetical protein